MEQFSGARDIAVVARVITSYLLSRSLKTATMKGTTDDILDDLVAGEQRNERGRNGVSVLASPKAERA